MKRIPLLPLLLLAFVPALPSWAQRGAPAPATATPPGEPAPLVVPQVSAIPEKPLVPAPAAAAGSAPMTNSSTTVANGGVLLNFQNAALNDVLTYLSEACGFVIVQEAPVTGTVNIVSRQSLNPDEAVDLLNTVLVEKGYTAIRNGRILKIVTRRDAPRRDLPVNLGSDPTKIQRNDAIVTQILPLRFGEAGKLVENLRPLLSETATISANEGSNAILLTDTQTNIRRIAQIIQALDTSVSSISTITVFGLQFADAKEVAQIVTQLFAPAQTNQNQQGNRGRGGGGGGFGGFPGFGGQGGNGGQGGGGAQNTTAASEARSAAARVVAVADEQSNSVIVSSPEETVSTIREMINQIDTSITAVTDTRIFRLQNADSVELAATITSLFGEDTSANGNNRRTQNTQGNRNGGFPGFGGQQAATASTQSGRSLLQAKVVAVGDPRTNSLVVTAGKESMSSVAEIVGRLDSTTAKKQHVYVHSLQHADVDNAANVLRGMLGQATTTQSTGSVLQNRSQNGASISTTDSSSSNTNNRNTR